MTVAPTDLRASAGLAGTLSEELDSPIRNAVETSSTVSGRLAGWSIANGLGQLGTGWAAPLGTLKQRLADTATSLNANADAHTRNEQATADGWSAKKDAK